MGACCVGTSCNVTSPAACLAAGGTYQGNGTGCGPPNPCDVGPIMGACCLGQTCFVTTAADCLAAEGIYRGDATDCGPPNPCATGACCFGSEEPCQEMSSEECFAAQGVYRGDGTDCGPPDPCAIGACCLSPTFCFETTAADCDLEDGLWLGPNSDCGPPGGPNPCGEPAVGACCILNPDVSGPTDPQTGGPLGGILDPGRPSRSCLVTTEVMCDSIPSGIYLGDGTDCSLPNPCTCWKVSRPCAEPGCVPDLVQPIHMRCGLVDEYKIFKRPNGECHSIHPHGPETDNPTNIDETSYFDGPFFPSCQECCDPTNCNLCTPALCDVPTFATVSNSTGGQYTCPESGETCNLPVYTWSGTIGCGWGPEIPDGTWVPCGLGLFSFLSFSHNCGPGYLFNTQLPAGVFGTSLAGGCGILQQGAVYLKIGPCPQGDYALWTQSTPQNGECCAPWVESPTWHAPPLMRVDA